MTSKNIITYIILFFVLSWNNSSAQLSYKSQNLTVSYSTDPLNLYNTPALLVLNKCDKSKKMKKTGYILLISGTTAIIGGFVAFGSGISKSEKYGNDPQVKNDGSGLIIGGLSMVLLGLVSDCISFPFIVKGIMRSRQYCENGTNSFNLISSNNGIGLQYKF